MKTVLAALTEDLNLISPQASRATPRVAPVGAAPDSEVSDEDIKRKKQENICADIVHLIKKKIRQYDKDRK